MATIAQNTEIKVDGMATVYGGFETTNTISLKTGATSTYVDIDYHPSLGLPTTRYWFDADGDIEIPFGDLARALVDAGQTGTQTIMTVTDEATQSALAVSVKILAGNPTTIGGQLPNFPPRKSIFISNTKGIALTSSKVDTYLSTDGVTWTGPTTLTPDDYFEVYFDMPTDTKPFAKVCPFGSTDPLWIGQYRTEWCGSTLALAWTSDSGKHKSWIFEGLTIEREQTDSRSTEGAGAMRGTFFPTQKNWKLKATAVVRDLAVDESWYFDDLFTGEVTTALLTEAYLVVWPAALSGTTTSAVITDKKITRSLTAQTVDITIKVDLMQIKNY